MDGFSLRARIGFRLHSHRARKPSIDTEYMNQENDFFSLAVRKFRQNYRLIRSTVQCWVSRMPSNSIGKMHYLVSRGIIQ